MSTAPVSGSVLHRLGHTPLRDLIRGRVTGRLDLDGKIDRSHLPPEAGSVIRQTIKSTRLHRLEKSDVADELIAHFRDAFAGGATVEQAAEDFGDPATAARLIRRAKKRNRPLAWKLLRAFSLAAAVIAMIAVLTVAKTLLRMPHPQTDYLALMNAEIASAPPQDTAWALYRDAWIDADLRNLDLSALENKNDLTGPGLTRPGDAGWATAHALLDRLQPMLTQVRHATRQPRMGLQLFYNLEGMSPEDSTLFYGSPDGHLRQQNTTETAEDRLRNQSLDVVFADHLQLIRRQATVMTADMIRAADQNDPVTVMDHAHALHTLARHTAETPYPWWCIHFAYIVHRRTAETIESLLARTPEVFSDDQLAELRALFVTELPAAEPAYAAARLAVMDRIQRVFADGGSGPATAAGVRVAGIQSLTVSNELDLHPGDGPWLLRLDSTRRTLAVIHRLPHGVEQIDLLDELVAAFTEDLNRPLRVFPDTAVDTILERIRPRGNAGTYFLAAEYVTVVRLLRDNRERTQARRDALVVGLALEQHRRQHGRYPDALGDLRMTAALPIDPITGNALRYRITDGRPVLYSVGFNRTDDHHRRATRDNGEPLTRWESEIAVAQWDPLDIPSGYSDGDWILYDARPATPLPLR